MKFLTPDQAVKARESLNLSQAKAAREAGVNRPYLSEFERSKRVLDDGDQTKLLEYYIGLGWIPSSEIQNTSVKQQLNSDKHDLTIMDGLVISPDAYDIDVHALLEESYEIEDELIELKQQGLRRGFFGGLDEQEALDSCLRPLILMGRLCEIKQILQGRFDSSYSEDGPLETVGDYIEKLLRRGVADRLIPSLHDNAQARASVDAVD